MTRWRKMAAVVVPALFLATGAMADGCTGGTLCSLFGGHSDDVGDDRTSAQSINGMPRSSYESSGSSTYVPPAPKTVTPTAAVAPGTAPAGAASQGSWFHGGPCSGTLCDLFHGQSTPMGGKATTSQDVDGIPSSSYGPSATPSASGKTSPMPTQSLATRARQSCEGGTMCDLFYGHTSSVSDGRTTTQSIDGTPASSFGGPGYHPSPATSATAAPARNQPAYVAPAAVASAAFVPAPEPPRPYVAPLPSTAASCTHSAKDPWSCYRH